MTAELQERNSTESRPDPDSAESADTHATRSTAPGGAGQPNDGHRNEVTLVGRLAGDIREREMPSGAILLSFRLVVRRDSVVHGPNIDALDCVAWDGAVHRVIRRWSAGDLVEVRGAVRRRFWRGVSGSVSRCEIEVSVVRRMGRAAAGLSGSRRAARATGSSRQTQADHRSGSLVVAGSTSSA